MTGKLTIFAGIALDLLCTYLNMEGPFKVSRRLLSISSLIERGGTGRMSTLRRLCAIAAAMPGGRPSLILKLKGPFSLASKEAIQFADVRGEYEGLIIKNDQFIDLAVQAAGATTGDDREDFEGPFHTITLDLTFGYEKPEPSVGVGGGTYLDDWTVTSLDGIMFGNSTDHAAVEGAVASWVDENKNAWIAEKERRDEEGRAEV